jgi:hypothetical protein
VPVVAEPIIGVARAEFPESGVPGGAFSHAGAWVGRDEPSAHDFLEKAVAEQALAMDALEFARLEDAPLAFLKRLEGAERVGQLLMGRRHSGTLMYPYTFLAPHDDRYLVPRHYTSMLLCSKTFMTPRRPSIPSMTQETSVSASIGVT